MLTIQNFCFNFIKLFLGFLFYDEIFSVCNYACVIIEKITSDRKTSSSFSSKAHIELDINCRLQELASTIQRRHCIRS